MRKLISEIYHADNVRLIITTTAGYHPELFFVAYDEKFVSLKVVADELGQPGLLKLTYDELGERLVDIFNREEMGDRFYPVYVHGNSIAALEDIEHVLGWMKVVSPERLSVPWLQALVNLAVLAKLKGVDVRDIKLREIQMLGAAAVEISVKRPDNVNGNCELLRTLDSSATGWLHQLPLKKLKILGEMAAAA